MMLTIQHHTHSRNLSVPKRDTWANPSNAALLAPSLAVSARPFVATGVAVWRRWRCVLVSCGAAGGV